MKALSIDRHGCAADVELSVDGSVGILRGLHAVIGCAAVERVAIGGGLDLWVDEDGIAAARPVNGPAGLLARELGMPVQLRGTVVVTGAERERGRAVGLTGAQIADLRRRLVASSAREVPGR